MKPSYYPRFRAVLEVVVALNDKRFDLNKRATLDFAHMLAADSKVVCAPVTDASKVQPAGDWKQIIEPVEPFLEAVGRRLAKQVEAFDPDIARYADYALNGQGKHLRAALVALTAKALGKVNDAHVTAAVIIEMVHLATLVHDDVIDEAEIRRGRPTLAANWSNEIAVLVRGLPVRPRAEAGGELSHP